MKYYNPIISGLHPDPSICRVEEDYYLVNSSFEYFPGIPIFHSKDLLHWEPIGHCITRNTQLSLRKGFPNCTGIYAPTLRYHNGIFYVITTNISYGGEDDGNFLIWTKDPYGEWSDPIWLDLPGIDPSLFFDEDGKVYYTGTYNEIILCEIDISTGKIIGEKKNIWAGTGGNDPEGPHIYKINDWYYLFISEGGTEYGHMLTVARSRNINGPYESCPRNPVLSNRSHGLPIKAVGHADITSDQNGNWWAVCLGIRTLGYPFKHNLGRETMLTPLVWDEDGWPIFGRDGLLDEEIETECLPLQIGGISNETINGKCFKEDFSNGSLHPSWNFIYNPIAQLWKIEKGEKGLTLYGNEVALSQADSLAWIGRRQEHHNCIVRTKLNFELNKDGEEAGLSIYMNNSHHYEVALTRIAGKNSIIVRRQIGTLWKVENVVLYDHNEVILEIEASVENYTFRYSSIGEKFETIGQGETAYLTTEVGGKFTGNYFALFATGNGKSCEKGALFEWFEYTVGI